MASNLRDSTIVAKAKGRRPLPKTRTLVSTHPINYKTNVIDFGLLEVEKSNPIAIEKTGEAIAPKAPSSNCKNIMFYCEGGSSKSRTEDSSEASDPWVDRLMKSSLAKQNNILDVPNLSLSIDYDNLFSEDAVSIEFLPMRGSLSSDEEETESTREITRQLAPKIVDKPIFKPRIITRDHKMTQEDWDDWNNHLAEFDHSIKPKSAIKGQRLRGICFTLNNYTEVDQKNLRDRFDAGMFTYLVFGREVGSNGTPHLQGYAHFSKQLSFEQMKEAINKRAHLEYARADGDKFASRWIYCKKDGDFEEFGVQPQHGGQLKKQTMMDLIKDGKSQLEIRELMPQAYFHSKNKLNEWFDDERKMKPEVRQQTNFYILENSTYLSVYELISRYFPDEYFAFVSDLSKLERYVDTNGYVKNICLINPDDITEAEGWSYGTKIIYKYGFQYREITCDNLVISKFFLQSNQLKKYKRLEIQPGEEPIVCKQTNGPREGGENIL